MEWFEFDLLEKYPHVAHGVFLRHEESESAGYREGMKKAIACAKLIFPNQIHGVNVERVSAKNVDKTFHADALFTTERDVALGIAHADCQAAVFYDPVHEAIGVAHAGWRGLTQNIYARLIETMQREIGTQPQNLIVCISPSLGPDHAEYKNYKQEFPKHLWRFQVKPNHFDFWAIAKDQLLSAGVLEKHLEITEICTHCHKDEYFSYRRDKTQGRHGTVVSLKSGSN